MSRSYIAADICIIGGGAGGLSVAASAAQMGADTVLIEKSAMGGDCLNSGCVPSKALLAAGNVAQTVRDAARFGIVTTPPSIDGGAVFRHVERTVRAIAPHDSVERFEALGVRVIPGTAAFADRRTVRVETQTGTQYIRARRFVIATGSHPFIPPIAGLNTIPFLTNETVFTQDEIPESVIIIGAGPIGIEMAQAHRRLGARVTILEAGKILPKDDPDLVAVVRRRLEREAIEIHEHTVVSRVEGTAGNIRVSSDTTSESASSETSRTHGASHILIAAGRRANIAGLDLENAAIAHDAHAVVVDDRLRTSNRRVFAVGDVIGKAQFTHAAGYHAGIVIRNALLRLPAKAKATIPWVTYSDPELAHVGMRATEAEARFGPRGIRILSASFADNDRARCEGHEDGLIKVVCAKNGRILGAGIVGPHGGELLQPWVLAISRGLKIGAMAAMIAPYPTLSEINKRVAGAFFTPRLFSPLMRKLVRFLARFG